MANNKSFQNLRGGTIENDKYLLSRINSLTQKDVSIESRLALLEAAVKDFREVKLITEAVVDSGNYEYTLLAEEKNNIVYFAASEAYQGDIIINVEDVLSPGEKFIIYASNFGNDMELASVGGVIIDTKEASLAGIPQFSLIEILCVEAGLYVYTLN